MVSRLRAMKQSRFLSLQNFGELNSTRLVRKNSRAFGSQSIIFLEVLVSLDRIGSLTKVRCTRWGFVFRSLQRTRCTWLTHVIRKCRKDWDSLLLSTLGNLFTRMRGRTSTPKGTPRTIYIYTMLRTARLNLKFTRSYLRNSKTSGYWIFINRLYVGCIVSISILNPKESFMTLKYGSCSPTSTKS